MIYENVHTSKEAKEVLNKEAHSFYCRYQSMLTEKEKEMNDIMTYKVAKRFYNEANVNVVFILVASNHCLADDTTLKSLESCNDVSNAVQIETTLAIGIGCGLENNFENKAEHGILNIENLEKYKYISLFDSRGDLIMCVDTAELEEDVREEYNEILEALRDEYEELSAAAATEARAEAYVESCKHGGVII